MKLGIGSFTYTWAIGVPGFPPEKPLSAFGLLDRAAALDIHLVQYADNLPLDRLTKRQLAGLRSEAKSRGIDIEVGTRGIEKLHLLTYLHLAEWFDSPFLRVVIDTPACQPEAEQVVTALKQVESAFKTAGVRLAIENHDRFPSAALKCIIEQLGPWAGICLDTVNSFGALEGPHAVVDQLAPLTIALHIKDFAIRRASHAMGFVIEGCPAGSGRLDIPWLLKTLYDRGCDPSAVLELWTPPSIDLTATIQAEANWAAESIRYLRSLPQFS